VLVELLDHFVARVLFDPRADNAVALNGIFHPRWIVDELGIGGHIIAPDRFGQAQVMLRDRFAGLPAADTATSKAYTALGFHAATGDLAKSIRSGQMDPGLARLPHVAMLAGGLVIEAGGAVLGGIGVAGAPGGDKDEACAKAGLDAIRDRIEF